MVYGDMVRRGKKGLQVTLEEEKGKRGRPVEITVEGRREEGRQTIGKHSQTR